MNDTAGRAAMTASSKQSKTPVDIKNVGIVGAGQMGAGIAHVAAMAGFDVVMCDISEDQLKRAISNIDKNLTRQVSKGAVTEADKVAALARIKTSSSMDIMKDRDLVIEAATEDEETKKKIFKTICPVLKHDAILCRDRKSVV